MVPLPFCAVMLQLHPMTEQKPTWRHQSVLFIIAAVVLVLDQATKWSVEHNLAIGEAFYPFPRIADYFNILHTYNRGAAFGTFQGGGWFFASVAVVVAGFIIYYNTQLPPSARTMRISLGLMLAGAAGNNLIDRPRLGHVTDFVHINLRPLMANYPRLDFAILDWPVFNVADMAIVSGVIIMAILLWREGDALPTAVAPPPAVPPAPAVYAFHQPGWSQEQPLPTAALGDTRLARFTLWAGLAWTAALIITLSLTLRALIRRR